MPTPSGECAQPEAVFTPAQLLPVIAAPRTAAFIVKDPAANRIGLSTALPQPGSGHQLIGTLPPLYPEWLGDRSFCEIHGIRFPYVSGAMANGIATTQLVIAMAKNGMLGFFGAAGLGGFGLSGSTGRLSLDLERSRAGEPAGFMFPARCGSRGSGDLSRLSRDLDRLLGGGDFLRISSS